MDLRREGPRATATGPEVFVVVLNWNGWRDTIECLESLQQLDYPDFRMVVVDNGSSGSSETCPKPNCNGASSKRAGAGEDDRTLHRGATWLALRDIRNRLAHEYVPGELAKIYAAMVTTGAAEFRHLFIVGVAKAGTTSLYQYLGTSSGVYMCPVKEPHFFSPDAVKNPGTHQRVVDWDAHVRLFAGATSEIAIGEASPSCVWDSQSPRLIRERLPNAKIIIVLRDLLERAYSHYLTDVPLGWQRLPFQDALQADARQTQKGWGISHLYLELGEYSEQIACYFETFGRDAIKVMLFDDLTRNAHRAYCSSRVCPMRGVSGARHRRTTSLQRRAVCDSKRPVQALARRCVPATLRAGIHDTVLLKKRTKPPLCSEARVFPGEYYGADMRRLESLLGRRLP